MRGRHPHTPLQQHSRCLGGCAHAAPQGTRQAARPGRAQLPHVWLWGGDGAEQRLCRTQGGSGVRGHILALLGLRESRTLTVFAAWIWCWHRVLFFCPHKTPPEVRWQCQEPSHHLYRRRNGDWRKGPAAPVAAPAACAPLTLHCRGVSSMMASGVGLAEPCPTSVGPKTRDRLRTSILQSGLRDTL